MSKARNITFIIVVAAVCLLIAGYKVVDKVGLLPAYFDNGKHSYLEGRQLEKFPKLTFTGFLSGELQDDLENYVSDNFPAREQAVLANAGLQGTSISIANLPFGFDAYPTYFGSDIVFSPETRSLHKIPSKMNENTEKMLAEAVEEYTALDRSDSANFVIYIPDRSYVSSANPAMQYVLNAFNREDIAAEFIDKLTTGPEILLDSHETTSDYLEHYFNSDHHWRMEGAYNAYEELAGVLDLQPLEVKEKIVYDYDFFGSFCREGLSLAAKDRLTDYVIEFPYLEVRYGEEVISRTRKELFDSDEVDGDQIKYNSYGYYFGSDLDCVIYTVPENEEKGDLLIIADSYSQPIEPMLASHYNSTHVIDLRFFDSNINEYIQEHNFETVIILMSANNLFSSDTLDAFTPCSIDSF